MIWVRDWTTKVQQNLRQPAYPPHPVAGPEASAMTLSWTRLRSCSFSRYARPFFTLTWSHGSSSPIGRWRWT